MRLGGYRARYKDLDHRNKTLLGVALILALVGVGALIGGTWRGVWEGDTWTPIAEPIPLGSYEYPSNMVVHDGNLYVTNSHDLFLWNGVDDWTLVANADSVSGGIRNYRGLVSLDGYLYCIGDTGGTSSSGELGRWQVGDPAFTVVAETLIGKADIFAINGEIWAFGQAGLAQNDIYRFDGSDWSLVAAMSSTSNGVGFPVEYGGEVYCFRTGNAGNVLYKVVGSSFEAEIVESLDTSTYGSVVFDDKIYASTGPTNGRLLQADLDAGEFVIVADGYAESGGQVVDFLTVAGSDLYGLGYYGELLRYTGESWEQILPSYSSSDIRGVAYYDGGIYAINKNGVTLYYEVPESEPDPGLDTGGLLTIGSFWCTPSSPKVNQTVAWKITGVGINRAAIEYSIVDALTGEITTDTENLMYSDGVWWSTAVYNRPCRIVATPYIYGESGSVNGTAIVLEVLPETSPASNPGEAVSIRLEETINTVFEAGEIATRFMISATDWSGSEIPMWVPTLVLLIIVVLIIRRQQQ